MARVAVDVMLKAEIADPQGQAILAALPRLGFDDISAVRQGKHFELEVAEPVDTEQLRRLADTLLANSVIEEFTLRVLPA